MKFFLFVLILFIMNTVLYAKESGYSISTALVGMSMDYREYDDQDVILDSEKSTFKSGLLVGVDLNFAYTKVFESGNYSKIGVNLKILNGETEYVGSLLNSSCNSYGCYVSKSQNSIFDTDLKYKYSHIIKNAFSLNYGIGVGYRSWKRELSVTQIEVYKWLSIRPKVGFSYDLSKFRLGMCIEYQYGINPQMTILADAENPDTTVNLGAANIIQVSIPFNLSLTENIELFVEYIYENQSIDKSNTAPFIINGKEESILEPKSTANNQYAKFGVVFKF